MMFACRADGAHAGVQQTTSQPMEATGVPSQDRLLGGLFGDPAAELPRVLQGRNLSRRSLMPPLHHLGVYFRVSSTWE
jgi:hypothetical protein